MNPRPRYQQIDSPALQGLDYVARAQVVNAINCQLLAELVNLAGGEVVLPPGFNERVSDPTHIIVTNFDDDGSYRITTEPITPEWNHPGAGTRWERMSGPRRGAEEAELWEVYEQGPTLTTLRRIDENGEPIAKTPVLRIKTDYLRRGVSGWRRWAPPLEVIEGLAGQKDTTS